MMGLRAALCASTMICSLGVTAPLRSQVADTAPVTPNPPSDAKTAEQRSLSEIIVTGFHKSYADALAIKRNSDQITDSISADGLGRFPDLNIGEAIQRLPGVQINREADSRNATISLRGLPGTFARTTLNGVGFADPILSSATSTASTPLGAFNSDIFTSVTIIKSPDASDLAGGLSGNIDLRIAPAFARKPGGYMKASYEYDELGKLGSPQFTAGYSAHLGSRFAVFGTLSYKQEKFRRDSISVNTWANQLGAVQVGNQQAAGSNSVYDALAARYPGGVYYPSQVRQFVRYNKGHLLTGASGFEWQATDTLKVGTTGFYTERNLSDGTNQLLYIDTSAGNGTNTALKSTSAVAHFTSLGTPYVVDTPNGPRAYINQFSAENVQTFDSIRSEPAKQKTWAITPTIDFRQDRLHVSLQGTVSRAEVLADQIEIDLVQNPYRNLGPAGLNGITTQIYTGGKNLADFLAILNTPDASHIPAGGYPIQPSASSPTQAGAPMPGQAATVAADRLGLTGTNGRARNQLNATQIDMDRSFDHSILSSLQAGLRYEQNRYISTGSRNTALGTSAANIDQSFSSASPYASDFFNGDAPGFTGAWRTVNVSQILAAVTPVNTGPRSGSNPGGLPGQFIYDPSTGVFLTPYGLVNNYADPNYWNNNFTNETDIASAYIMGRWDFHLGGVRIRGNAGLRYEHSHQAIDALDCLNCASALAGIAAPPVIHALADRSYHNNYGYWLPSAMIAADLTGRLKLRGAYYKTYVRPQPRDNVPITFVQTPEILSPAVDPVYSVQIGATHLRPYTANSFDVALEWYNRPGGLFSITAFQKNVKGYIGAITDPHILCPSNGLIDGVDYGLGTLSVVGPNCVSSNRFVGAAGTLVNATVQISGITNQRPIRVRGLEFAVQQNFDFLPGFLRYFGGAANYTYVEIKGTDTAGYPITLPNVSKHNLNLIGFYETKCFGIRLTYNYRGKYDLSAGNSFVGDARSVKARGQLDASASLNLIPGITMSIDAFNLTDATRAEYENDPMLPRRIDYDGRTYRATLRADF
jgi:TonB-dependent receptor